MTEMRLQWRRPDNALTLAWRGPDDSIRQALANDPMAQITTMIGPPGRDASASQSASFTYAAGFLTRIDYADGSHKALSYTNGLLSRIDHVREAEGTLRKDFMYSNGVLISVTQEVLL